MYLQLNKQEPCTKSELYRFFCSEKRKDEKSTARESVAY